MIHKIFLSGLKLLFGYERDFSFFNVRQSIISPYLDSL